MEVKESLGQEVVILNIMKEDYERRDHSQCQHAFPAKQKLENTQYNHIYLCACAHTCTHTHTCMRAHTHARACVHTHTSQFTYNMPKRK